MSKDNKKEVNLQSDLPDQGIEFAHRRQIIRGLASIPVAMTLSSGAAVANTSSHACLTNETSTPPICSENSMIPGWLNSPGKIVSPLNSGKPAKYCVAYAEDDGQGGYTITGYNYQHFSYQRYVGPDGKTVIGNLTGNPLRASCATSFLH